ncbi:acyl-CoA thioesterase [Rhodococcus sp. BH4]|uniref:acyl-CoA thioesterase n=1 Tax=Rhodococcus sp. BH4 TaxID=1807790 RepID=UPI001E35DF82|nr:acyl-CoA thioesterase [Rhodococcus sp. BH4]
MSSADSMESIDSLVVTGPRPDPARLSIDLYPIRRTSDSRFGDMDANAHLNNLALEAMHENARAVLNGRLFPGLYDPKIDTVRLVTSQNVVHFLVEAHWPARIDTGIGIGRIGRTSFVASSALFHNGQCTSLCDTVLVALGSDGPVALTSDVRSALEGLWLGSGFDENDPCLTSEPGPA